MIFFITGIIGVLVAGMIIWLMRRDLLHVQHGLGWILVALTFVLLGFAPSIFDTIAASIGVRYPPALALTVALALLVLKIFVMDIERSRLQMRNQRLVQRLAILEVDFKKLRELVIEKRAAENDDNSTNRQSR